MSEEGETAVAVLPAEEAPPAAAPAAAAPDPGPAGFDDDDDDGFGDFEDADWEAAPAVFEEPAVSDPPPAAAADGDLLSLKGPDFLQAAAAAMVSYAPKRATGVPFTLADLERRFPGLGAPPPAHAALRWEGSGAQARLMYRLGLGPVPPEDRPLPALSPARRVPSVGTGLAAPPASPPVLPRGLGRPLSAASAVSAPLPLAPAPRTLSLPPPAAAPEPVVALTPHPAVAPVAPGGELITLSPLVSQEQQGVEESGGGEPEVASAAVAVAAAAALGAISLEEDYEEEEDEFGDFGGFEDAEIVVPSAEEPAAEAVALEENAGVLEGDVLPDEDDFDEFAGFEEAEAALQVSALPAAAEAVLLADDQGGAAEAEDIDFESPFGAVAPASEEENAFVNPFEAAPAEVAAVAAALESGSLEPDDEEDEGDSTEFESAVAASAVAEEEEEGETAAAAVEEEGEGSVNPFEVPESAPEPDVAEEEPAAEEEDEWSDDAWHAAPAAPSPVTAEPLVLEAMEEMDVEDNVEEPAAAPESDGFDDFEWSAAPAAATVAAEPAAAAAEEVPDALEDGIMAEPPVEEDWGNTFEAAEPAVASAPAEAERAFPEVQTVNGESNGVENGVLEVCDAPLPEEDDSSEVPAMATERAAAAPALPAEEDDFDDFCEAAPPTPEEMAAQLAEKLPDLGFMLGGGAARPSGP